MTAGIKTHGTKIAISNGESPETFTNLGECRVVPQSGGTSGLIDASNHDTVGNMDYLAKDLSDGDEIECECNYVASDAGQNAFKAAYDSKTAYNFREILTNSTFFLFAGRVTGWHLDAGELDDIVKQKFTVKITGKVYGPTAV
jgi:hypothetical protein